MHTDRDLELTYCTNIHPGETLSEVEENIRSFTVPIKHRVSPDRPMGVGLRLSNEAARELAADESRTDSFRELLDAHDLYVFTLNGFPYGSFHGRRVKDDVYRPDWRSDERLRYTERLIDVLHGLLQNGSEGSISTSPLSYKPWLSPGETEDALHEGARRLASAAFHLFDLREQAGRLIHLGIEPEPDCLIENCRETVDFFENRLLFVGAELLRKQHGLGPSQAEDAIRRHIRVCYDTCHFAVEYESPEQVLTDFERAGILLSKIQLSSALRVPLSDSSPAEVKRALEPFAESTYLHQVVARVADGALHRYADLPDALSAIDQDEAEEWRIHFHVPIFVDTYHALLSTRDDLVTAAERVQRDGSCRHLEIETYTWDVLPDELKTDAVSSIAREFEWMLGRLKQTA